LIKLFASTVPGFGNTVVGLVAFVAIGSVVTGATFAAFATATFAAATFGVATTFEPDAATFGAVVAFAPAVSSEAIIVASRAFRVTFDPPAPSAACCTACSCTTFVASR
jgi:hypothetical protein